MPELPEVETVARGLAGELVGRRITRVEVRYAGSVHEPREAFAAKVAGRAVVGVRRRAKMLLLDLDDASHLGCHLKMTGRLFVPGPETASLRQDKHCHVVLELDDGRCLLFHDTRKFGWLRHFTPESLAALPFYRSLGPEPLEMSEAQFVELLSGRQAAIKALLLNQALVVGVGNIYADEALHRARIHPKSRAARLTPARLRKLFAALRQVLHQAIAANGSTINDYRTAQGDAGAFQKEFLVYGRKGHPCAACATPLVAEVVAGRTSTYCPRCQKVVL